MSSGFDPPWTRLSSGACPFHPRRRSRPLQPWPTDTQVKRGVPGRCLPGAAHGSEQGIVFSAIGSADAKYPKWQQVISAYSEKMANPESCSW